MAMHAHKFLEEYAAHTKPPPVVAAAAPPHSDAPAGGETVATPGGSTPVHSPLLGAPLKCEPALGDRIRPDFVVFQQPGYEHTSLVIRSVGGNSAEHTARCAAWSRL